MNLGLAAFLCAAAQGFYYFAGFEESFTGCHSVLNFNKYS